MTSPVNNGNPLSGVSSTSASAAAVATPPLDQHAFLKLLMAQLQNQDPLAPTDGTQFVTQLAQFSQVEQAVAQSTKLDTIGTQLQGLNNSNTTALVGKTVTVSGNGMQWDGRFASTANVALGAAAQKVTVTISDAQGNAVRTLNLGAEAAGTLPITWDGQNDAGQAAPAGAYSMKISATDGNGQSVAASQAVSGVVTKVSYDKGYPELTLSTGAVAPVSQLVSVAVTPAAP